MSVHELLNTVEYPSEMGVLILSAAKNFVAHGGKDASGLSSFTNFICRPTTHIGPRALIVVLGYRVWDLGRGSVRQS